MIGKIILATGLLLAPQLASAQTIVTDPKLELYASQQLAVQKQQLAVLSTIQALLQVQVTAAQASAAIAYAQQQGKVQDQALAASSTTATP